MSDTNQKNILLIVEDSNEDYYATKRAFDNLSLSTEIYRAQDGKEAIDYLYHQNKFSDIEKSPAPDLILLDLNLPGLDGKEVLNIIKKDETLNKIPVIILTTSSAPEDIENCYKIGANSYIQKPVGLDKFFEAIDRLQDYWFRVVVLPGKGN